MEDLAGDCSVLAKVFAAFGNRLLEQNVRTYLQAKTGVNKGILRTIAEEPGMFFAYNNGVTARGCAEFCVTGAWVTAAAACLRN